VRDREQEAEEDRQPVPSQVVLDDEPDRMPLLHLLLWLCLPFHCLLLA
jgi:hypothetical protein